MGSYSREGMIFTLSTSWRRRQRLRRWFSTFSIRIREPILTTLRLLFHHFFFLLMVSHILGPGWLRNERLVWLWSGAFGSLCTALWDSGLGIARRSACFSRGLGHESPFSGFFLLLNSIPFASAYTPPCRLDLAVLFHFLWFSPLGLGQVWGIHYRVCRFGYWSKEAFWLHCFS